MLIRGRHIEKIFLIIAFSSISILALIAFFIFEQGVPLIWKVGLRSFLFGDRWFPSQGSFGIFPMIIGSFWVTLGALVVGVEHHLSQFFDAFFPPHPHLTDRIILAKHTMQVAMGEENRSRAPNS
jgi:hypothetical protein